MPGARAASADAERVGVLRVGEPHVDGGERFGGGRIRRIRGHRDQIRQVHARLEPAAP